MAFKTFTVRSSGGKAATAGMRIPGQFASGAQPESHHKGGNIVGQKHFDTVSFDTNKSFRQGFRVGVLTRPAVTNVPKNLQSAVNDPGTVGQLIEKDVRRKYVIGPFTSSPFSVFRTSCRCSNREVFREDGLAVQS